MMTTAKKAAAAPKSEDKTDDAVNTFPLTASRYFSVPVMADKSESSGAGVAAIQRALGIEESGTYDEATRDAVVAWQEENKREATGVVSKDDWQALVD